MVEQRIPFNNRSYPLSRSLMTKTTRNNVVNTLCVFSTVKLCLRYTARDPRLRFQQVFAINWILNSNISNNWTNMFIRRNIGRNEYWGITLYKTFFVFFIISLLEEHVNCVCVCVCSCFSSFTRNQKLRFMLVNIENYFQSKYTDW